MQDDHQHDSGRPQQHRYRSAAKTLALPSIAGLLSWSIAEPDDFTAIGIESV
jgi:hypothetical protein